MSIEYTAEDFAQAEFARHADGRKAMRIGSDSGIFRWWVGKYGGATDEHMSRGGWTPVVESRVTEHTLRDAQAPLSLDSLSAEWEAAEVPTSGFSAGDLCIERCADDHYEVFRANSDMAAWSGDLRILSRAPRREPWSDLADVLADMGHLSPTGHAKALYERGVRMAGGEES